MFEINFAPMRVSTTAAARDRDPIDLRSEAEFPDVCFHAEAFSV